MNPGRIKQPRSNYFLVFFAAAFLGERFAVLAVLAFGERLAVFFAVVFVAFFVVFAMSLAPHSTRGINKPNATYCPLMPARGKSLQSAKR